MAVAVAVAVGVAGLSLPHSYATSKFPRNFNSAGPKLSSGTTTASLAPSGGGGDLSSCAGPSPSPSYRSGRSYRDADGAAAAAASSAVSSSRSWGDSRALGIGIGIGIQSRRSEDHRGGDFMNRRSRSKGRRERAWVMISRAMATAEGEEIKPKGLQFDGPGKGGQWLSCTTRHVRIYIGVIDPETEAMDQTQLDKITLMLDTDKEFIWPDDKAQKVFDYFAELVEVYAGAPCTEYTLRLIGSDLEHFIRKMLLANEIKYNLDCRVLNFSMGKPRYQPGVIDVPEE